MNHIPGYLRRDMHRIYGRIVTVGIGRDVEALLQNCAGVLSRGQSAAIDGWVWRHLSGFGCDKRGRSIIVDRLSCGVVYQKRGDLLICFAEA